MTRELLVQVQQRMLLIMDDIHRVCVENGLKYYMIGGTALGSVRHKGFIPWDPDIDIAMLRDDYEKFLELAPNKLAADFICHTYRTDKDYYPPHAIVEMKRTYLRTNVDDLNESLRPKGIYVDILPLDFVPDSESLQRKQERDLLRIKKMKYRKRSKIYLKDKFLSKTAKRFISLALKSVSWYKLNIRQERIMRRHNDDSSREYICSMVSHYGYQKLKMKADLFGEPKLYPFEGREYYGAADMEMYLTKLFGNYMKMPPNEQQDALLNMYVDARLS